MTDRKFLTSLLFFSFGCIAVGLIGAALWPEAPGEFVAGSVFGLLGLSVAVWGATR